MDAVDETECQSRTRIYMETNGLSDGLHYQESMYAAGDAARSGMHVAFVRCEESSLMCGGERR